MLARMQHGQLDSKGGLTFRKVCHSCSRAVLSNTLLVLPVSPGFPEADSVSWNATAWARRMDVVKAAAGTKATAWRDTQSLQGCGSRAREATLAVQIA